MASPKKQTNKKKSILRPTKYSTPQKNNARLGSSNNKVSKSKAAMSAEIGPEQHTAQTQHNLNVRSHAKKSDVDKVAAKNSNKSANMRKALQKQKGRTYILRSFDTGRMLRSMKNAADAKALQNQPSPPVVLQNLVSKARKKGKLKGKKVVEDELSRFRKHIRYLLNRMNYEQSLIDAYVGEGWKGQSADKIRPEKELERARSEINRCKLKIREIFKRLDSLMAEGRLQESLFDPDGIYSENIFCGKCGLEDISADNDIILCDGICQRGFHQKCLNPPLLSENIPDGDDDWLCPQCDCKVDCIDLLSEIRGVDLSIEDSWEKIFLEAAALENNDGKFDDLNLPSDDSEDEDYDPNAAVVGVNEQDEESSHEASDSSYSYDDSTSSHPDMTQATLELPSDDSEDGNYDPVLSDTEKEFHKGSSSSNESDFTSDSDEFCTELGKATCTDDATASSPQSLEAVGSVRDNIKDNDKCLPTLKLRSDDSEDDDYDPDSPDTEKEFQKGNSSLNESDFTSDSDEFCAELGKATFTDEATASSLPSLEVVNSSKAKIKDNDKFYNCPDGTFVTPDVDRLDGGLRTSRKRCSERLSGTKLYDDEHSKLSSGSNIDEVRNNSTPKKMKISKVKNNVKKKHELQNSIASSDQDRGPQEPHSSGFRPASASREPQFATMKLYEVFQETQHPTRQKKESLARELGRTFKQVTKWFENARGRFRTTAKLSSHASATTSAEAPSTPCQTRPSGFLDSAKGSSTPKMPSVDKALSSLSVPNRSVAIKSSGASTPLKHADAEGKARINSEKKLEDSEGNRYPSRQTKKRLAEELCMTFHQVNARFNDARHDLPSTGAIMPDKVAPGRTPTTRHNLRKAANLKSSGASPTPCAALNKTTNARKTRLSHSKSDKVTTPGSSTGPSNLDSGVKLESPEVQNTNGATNNATNTRRTPSSYVKPDSQMGDASSLNKRKTTIGTKATEGGSGRKRSIEAFEGRDRGKAIAKELRRMRWGR